MRIPLYNKLRRQFHREIGLLQDNVVEIVYSLNENAVLHGGTAVWRCFNGNRFSEDLDFYFVPEKNFGELLAKKLSFQNMELVKFKSTGNSFFSKVKRDNVIVSLEVSVRIFKKPIVKEFEKIDGNFLDVFTLPVEELFLEKLNAFKNRKLIRDIYDVYHLSKFVEKNSDFDKKVFGLLDLLPLPVDEKNLKALVLFGAIPSYSQMLEVLKKRFSK